MTANAANRKDIRAAEKASRLADRARHEVLTATMQSILGRQYVWDLLVRCHCFQQSFAPDPLLTAFREGERAVGLSILADIMLACPDLYITASREANDRITASERAGSQNGDRGDQGRESDDWPVGYDTGNSDFDNHRDELN